MTCIAIILMLVNIIFRKHNYCCPCRFYNVESGEENKHITIKIAYKLVRGLLDVVELIS